MLPRSKIANAAGVRNNYVQIEKATDAAANGSYEVVSEFNTTFSRWSETLITSGYEFTQAMQQNELIRAILKLPYDPVTAAITSRDRVNDSGVIYNIDAVYNEGTNNEKIVLWLIGTE